MSEEKILTKEIAEQFLADEDSVDLSEFMAIDDDAAEVLATCGKDVVLQEVADCSPHASIRLTSSPNIETPTADALCMLKAHGRKVSDVLLHLTVLKLSSDELAIEVGRASDLLLDMERLDEHEELNGAEEKYRVITSLRENSWRLTEEIASAWLQLNENYCEGILGLVQYIEDGALQPIIEGDRELDFSGLKSLSDETANALGQFGETVTLWGLRTISDAGAEALGACKGELRIDLDELPESAAAILRKHPSFDDEA